MGYKERCGFLFFSSLLLVESFTYLPSNRAFPVLGNLLDLVPVASCDERSEPVSHGVSIVTRDGFASQILSDLCMARLT